MKCITSLFLNLRKWMHMDVFCLLVSQKCSCVWRRSTRRGNTSPYCSCPLASRTGHSPQSSVTPKRGTVGALPPSANPSLTPHFATLVLTAVEEVRRTRDLTHFVWLMLIKLNAEKRNAELACCFEASSCTNRSYSGMIKFMHFICILHDAKNFGWESKKEETAWET